MLYRPKPYWYRLESQNAVMGGFVPRSSFPLCYDATSTASGGRATSST